MNLKADIWLCQPKLTRTLSSGLIVPKCQTSGIKSYHITPTAVSTGSDDLTPPPTIYRRPEIRKACKMEVGAPFLALQEQVYLAFFHIRSFFILENCKTWPYCDAVGERRQWIWDITWHGREEPISSSSNYWPHFLVWARWLIHYLKAGFAREYAPNFCFPCKSFWREIKWVTSSDQG